MAKPLGPKSRLIRQAIASNPGMGNTELAEMLNDADDRIDDKFKITANDVAQQRQAMKKAGAVAAPTPAPSKPVGNGRKKPGRKPAASAVPAATANPAPAQSSPVDLIDKTLDLAQQCGGVAALKRLVDRLAEIQGR